MFSTETSAPVATTAYTSDNSCSILNNFCSSHTNALDFESLDDLKSVHILYSLLTRSLFFLRCRIKDQQKISQIKTLTSLLNVRNNYFKQEWKALGNCVMFAWTEKNPLAWKYFCHLCTPCGNWLSLSLRQTESWERTLGLCQLAQALENKRQTLHDSNLNRSRHEGHSRLDSHGAHTVVSSIK